jgi:hypothetical protein
MQRKKTGRKRGRRYNPHARRHQTTRAGRRGEVDRGSERLRQRKRLLTGREDVEMTAAGALYGHGHLDNAQYTKLGVITAMLRNVQVAMGKGSLSVAGIWSALIDRSHTRITALPLLGDHGARQQLSQVCCRLDGCRSLVIALAEERSVPPIVIRAVEHYLSPRDLVMLEMLRQGLDAIIVRSREPD